MVLCKEKIISEIKPRERLNSLSVDKLTITDIKTQQKRRE
nr:MAG TPA: hypothetical protein [Caudoviricetes sp.]